MELREAFEAADTDKGGALEIEEVSETVINFLNNLNKVHISFRWSYWQRNES
jgi:hypothetical protein